MEPTKTKDDELSTMIVVLGIFSLGLLILDLTYSNLGGMFSGPDAWVGIVWAILHGLIAVLWFIVAKYWQDPNRDLFRIVLAVALVAAIILTGMHRAGWIENKAIIEDSRKSGVINFAPGGEYSQEELATIVANALQKSDTVILNNQILMIRNSDNTVSVSKLSK